MFPLYSEPSNGFIQSKRQSQLQSLGTGTSSWNTLLPGIHVAPSHVQICSFLTSSERPSLVFPRHSEPMSATKALCSPSLDQGGWHLFFYDLCTKNYYYIFKWLRKKIQRKNISWHMNIIWNSNFSVHKILLEHCHTYASCFCQNLRSWNKNLQSLKAGQVLHRKFAYPCLALHSTSFLCLKHFFRIRLGASLLFSTLYFYHGTC